jgi:hypothetical protein
VSEPPFITIIRDCGVCGGAGCEGYMTDDLVIYHKGKPGPHKFYLEGITIVHRFHIGKDYRDNR